jgi:hypothetical protein
MEFGGGRAWTLSPGLQLTSERARGRRENTRQT